MIFSDGDSGDGSDGDSGDGSDGDLGDGDSSDGWCTREYPIHSSSSVQFSHC